MARRPHYFPKQLASNHPGSQNQSGNHARGEDSGTEEIMRPEDLQQFRHNLSHLSIDAVRHAYHTAYARCRMVNDHVPSARSIQELVQVWKQLWKWR